MHFGFELEAAQMNPLSYGGNNTVFIIFIFSIQLTVFADDWI